MSVICRGKMPDSCAACPASYLVEHSKRAARAVRICPMKPERDVTKYDDSRPEDCFFIKELPRKHGRLIDADRLISVLESAVPYSYRGLVFRETVSLINRSPTIAEAEG